jgi:hypothetical protein
MKKIIVLMITLFIVSNVFAGNMDVPKSIKIIAQSGTSYSICITAIDLSNNELIIIEYAVKVGPAGGGKIVNITHTGITLDPKEYTKITMTDIPFKTE